MNNQGIGSKKVFHGKGKADVIKRLYGESASLFSQIIRKNLKEGKYTLADLGGHKGELLIDIISELPEYEFDTIIVDKVEGVDEGLKVRKIVGDIINNEIPSKSVDVVIMRYVLPWDHYDNQKLILKEVQRMCRGFAIIQHQGAPNENPQPLQDASRKLWSGMIPALKRDNGFFTEARQVENWMADLGISFEKIDEKYIEDVSRSFIEKFGLSDVDAKMVRDILSSCDGITITTWVLKFGEIS